MQSEYNSGVITNTPFILSSLCVQHRLCAPFVFTVQSPSTSRSIRVHSAVTVHRSSTAQQSLLSIFSQFELHSHTIRSSFAHRSLTIEVGLYSVSRNVILLTFRFEFQLGWFFHWFVKFQLMKTKYVLWN